MLLNSTIYPVAPALSALDWKTAFLAAVSTRVEARCGNDSQTALLSAQVALAEADAQLHHPGLKGVALVLGSFQKQNAIRNLANARLAAEGPKAELDQKLTGRARTLAAFDRENTANPECARYSKKD